ncbi:MAG: ABC transporter permease, partial [Thermoleophilia bacterium]|nr:ABC transporter permease [Thermoleophilia bacterium]
RNRPLWALLTAVPAIFILLAVAVTPDDAIAVALTEGGRSALATVPMPDLHVATMGTLAIAALSGLAGVFVACDAGEADRRLAVAGFRSGELLLARGVVVATAALLVTAVSLGVTALVLRPERWGAYVAANLLIAAAYAALGVLLGPPAGRIGGLYLVFLIPFVDLGIGQSPMLRPEPPGWAELLPGYGASRLLVDAAFTAEFSEPRGVVIALAWVAALAGLAAAVLRRATSP